MKKERDWKFVLLLILIIIAIGAAGFGLFLEKDSTWICAQTDCSRFMTKQEIINTICIPNDEGIMICSLNVDGQVATVPLTQLNVSALNICAEYRCIAEMKIKEVDYPIEIPTA